MPAKRMSCEELRYWMDVLHRDHGWRRECLARTLGIGEGKHLASKVRGNSWIYRSEQVRMTKQIDRILSGELVPKEFGRHGRQEAVLAAHPVPLERKMRMRFDLASGRIGYVPRRAEHAGTMVSFSKGVEAFTR